MSDKLRLTAENLYAEQGCSLEAIRKLEDLIQSDEILMAYAIHQAAYTAMHQAQCAARSAITNPDKFQPKRYSRAFQERVQQACLGFYDWPLMDGTKLADATKEHVLQDADRFRTLAEGNARNSRFLRLVGEKLQAGSKVRDTFTEEQLAEIMEKAKRGGE